MNTIVVENLSKQYRLGVVGSGTLRDDVHKWLNSIRGKENPLLKLGEVNDQSVVSDSGYVWSLKDINFEVNQGDVLGVLGKNGAGKSTLLKILSRVTAPTTGCIKIKGKVASLLEVGTGFHPELTGRENIFLNGAILGMKRKEIQLKFDEIVSFSGIEKYVDTPVKRYSSGMYVRLAFAVAAHLDSDILIVDEVLAVGDADFQKKCLSKMKDVSSQNGKTVLFVSHNIESIERLCNRSILLDNGQIKAVGDTQEVTSIYLSNNINLCAHRTFENENFDHLPFQLISAMVHNENFNVQENFEVIQKIGVTFEYEVVKEGQVFIPAISVENEKEVDVFHSHDVESEFYKITRKKGVYKSTVWIPSNYLAEGLLTIGFGVLSHLPFEVYYHNKSMFRIKVLDFIKGDSARGFYNGAFPGIVRPKLEWITKI